MTANWKVVPTDRRMIVFALAAGTCSALATLLQFVTLGKWFDKTPWIILIGAMYPTVVILSSLLSGQRFTLTQWLGVFMAIAAIALITLPTRASD